MALATTVEVGLRVSFNNPPLSLNKFHLLPRVVAATALHVPGVLVEKYNLNLGLGLSLCQLVPGGQQVSGVHP